MVVRDHDPHGSSVAQGGTALREPPSRVGRCTQTGYWSVIGCDTDPSRRGIAVPQRGDTVSFRRESGLAAWLPEGAARTAPNESELKERTRDGDDRHPQALAHSRSQLGIAAVLVGVPLAASAQPRRRGLRARRQRSRERRGATGDASARDSSSRTSTGPTRTTRRDEGTRARRLGRANNEDQPRGVDGRELVTPAKADIATRLRRRSSDLATSSSTSSARPVLDMPPPTCGRPLGRRFRTRARRHGRRGTRHGSGDATSDIAPSEFSRRRDAHRGLRYARGRAAEEATRHGATSG